jgi:hypothetical protein
MWALVPRLERALEENRWCPLDQLAVLALLALGDGHPATERRKRQSRC